MARGHRPRRYAELFAEHRIDFDVLADLTEADLAQLGVSLGDRKRLMRAIARLTERTGAPADATGQPVPAPRAAKPSVAS